MKMNEFSVIETALARSRRGIGSVRAMRAGQALALCVAVLGAACSKSQPEDSRTQPAEPATPAATVSPANQPAVAQKPERIALVGEEDARAWLSAWLDAQNRGSFESYAAMYAASFRGVRRSGDRIVKLDHQGWLDDRKRMFKKPMSVEALDVRITPLPDHTELRFVQVWKSGSYADQGEKTIALARAGAEIRAIREEMLSSRPLVPSRQMPTPVTPRTFTVMRLSNQGEIALLLPDTWNWKYQVKSIGAPEALLDGSSPPLPVGVRRRLDESTLPPEFSVLRGKKVELISGQGARVCTVSIRDLYHVAVYAGERAVYTTILDRKEWSALLAAGKLPELGEMIWTRGHLSVKPMATIEVEQGDCSTSMWGRVPSDTAPSPGVKLENKTLASKVADEIWGHESYTEYLAKYDLESPPMTSKEWDARLEDSIEVFLFGAPRKPSVALLRSRIAELVYRITERGELEDQQEVGTCATVIGAVDADLDGRLDILSATTFGTGCLELSSGERIGL
jgi:hypothetical protein